MLVALAASACTGSKGATSTTGSDAPYNVDVISSLTGASSSAGVAVADAYKTVFNEVNSAGGINGHKVNILNVYDDQTSPSVATGLARKAVADRPVAILFGAAASAEAPAVLPVFQEAKLPVFSTTIYSFGLFPWNFTEQPTPGQFAILVTNDAKAALGSLTGKKVAFITAASPAGQAIAAGVKTAVAAAGGTVSDTEFQPVGAAAFSSGASNILSSGADVVVIGDTQDSTIVESKALLSAGFKGPIRSVSQGSPLVLQTINSPQFQGALQSAPANPGTGMNAAAQKAGTARSTSATNFTNAWINAYMLVKSLEKCDYPCPPAALQKAAESLGTFTIPGDATFGSLFLSPTSHNAITVAQNFAWDPAKNAAVKVGDPIPLGTPVYPAPTS